MNRLFKWGVKSAGGLAANLALLTLWVDGLGIHPIVAVLMNFVLISAVSYAIVNWWVFPDGVKPATWRGHLTQWAGMELAMIGGKGANYGIYIVLLPVFDYRVAWTVGAVATFALTYTLNKWWWRRDRAASPLTPATECE